MYLVSDVTKSGDWLFKSITENGILTVLAGICILLFAIIPLAFAKEWVVTGASNRRKDQQIEASNMIMAAQEQSRTEKIEKRLELLEDGQRDTLHKIEVIIDGVRDIKQSRGGERGVG